LKLSRRALLIGGGAGAGLIVGYALWPRHLPSELSVGPGEQAFGSFIKIGRDGRVTVAVPQAETGQGIWTALPQIVADELGAAWETVAVEPAPLAKAYANPLAKEEGWPEGIRITAGSTSVRAFEQPLREAAAVAREMLVGAAADRWNIEPSECEAADGLVINGVRTFGFGELAAEAAERTPPVRPQLRTGTRGRLIGKPLQRLDAPAKAAGSLRFAGDVRLPDMLYASARLAPPGGRMTGFARDAVAGLPAVRHVAARDAWFAVVADTAWAAERAVKAADPKFTGERTPADLRPLFEVALGDGRAHEWFSRGDYAAVTRGSRPLAATYYVAPSVHAGLEPPSATARFSGGRLEVWAASQAPGLARQAAARAAGVPEAQVALYPMAVGEPAGRALEGSAIAMAVELARELERPVQVTLSASSAQNHDRVSPGAMARMTALPGEGGITAAWAMRVATADGLGSALARLAGDGPPAKLARTALDGSVPPYSIPSIRVDAVHADVPLSAGYMRGSPQRELTFFTESFVDELARAAGMEPLAFRMSMLGGDPRLARCLQAAAQLAGWDGGGRGSTMGLAACSAFGSHIALVASATIGDDQRVKVGRMVAAVDCGRVINPRLAIQQVEGGLIWALAQATMPEPEWVAGMPRARPLGSLGLPRLADVPQLGVQLLPSNAAPGGLSGLAPTVVAPAVANAIFAGTGKRMRALPFDLMSVV
jgi:isoquinoline 1-oxidoreductase beta subunit